MNSDPETVGAKVTCTDCGAEFPTQEAQTRETKPCPKCGSVKRTLALSITEKLQPVHDSLTGKLKDTTLPSKRNPRVEFFVGDDRRRSDGKWMQKTRTIDKVKDQYSETVTDPETGKIVHKCEEPLSKHRGHGSAKKDKKLSNQSVEHYVSPGADAG